jgi:hypothetical protein
MIIFNESFSQDFEKNSKKELNKKKNTSKELSNNKIETNEYFFFKKILGKYKFEGYTWGDVNLNHLNNVKIKGSLYVIDLGQLKIGNVYCLNYLVEQNEDKITYDYKNFNEFLWVTKDSIFKFMPNINDDLSNFKIDGKLDELKYINYLIRNNKLPNNDKNLLIYCSSNFYLDSDNKLIEQKIINKNNKSTYNYTHNSGHFESYTWEIGQGLTYYSWGYGSGRSGMKLFISNL